MEKHCIENCIDLKDQDGDLICTYRISKVRLPRLKIKQIEKWTKNKNKKLDCSKGKCLKRKRCLALTG